MESENDLHMNHDGKRSLSIATQTSAGTTTTTTTTTLTTLPNEPKTKKCKKKHLMNPKMYEFRYKIHECCKKNNLPTAMIEYENAIKENIKIEAQTFYVLLNLCDGIVDKGIHIGTPKPSSSSSSTNNNNFKRKVATLESDNSNGDGTATTTSCQDNVIHAPQDVSDELVDLDSRFKFAEVIKKHMDTLSIPLTESAYNGLIKLLCKRNDMEQAERTLIESEHVQQCKSKLRLYTPLLTAYCVNNQLENALGIWARCCRKGLVITENEYLHFIECATRVGNAMVFEKVVSELAEDVVVPSKKTTNSIIQWFRSLHSIIQQQHISSNENKNETLNHETTTTNTTTTPKLAALLQEIKNPNSEMVPSLGPIVIEDYTDIIRTTQQPQQQQPLKKKEVGWTISESCTIDETTGEFQTGCFKGYKLNPVVVSDIAWQSMLQMNERIVTEGKVEEDQSQYQGGGKGKKRIFNDKTTMERKHHWEQFHNYLVDRKKRNPIQIIIDGANVGYYDTNFPGAPKHVCYDQINSMIQYLKKKNLSTFLVMHTRHFASNMLPKKYESMIQSWINDDILYRTPPNMNDDWFWLHAALVSGRNTMIITNDEMRDHQFQMLAPRSFIRWKDRHQIRFQLHDWQKVKKYNNNTSTKQEQNVIMEQHRTVQLIYPVPYSRRIQRVHDGLVIPHPKRNDMNRFLDGIFVAGDDEPMNETYVCIRPKIT